MASRVSCVVTHISLPRSGSQVQAYGHHVCSPMRRRGLQPTDQTEIRFRSPRYLFQRLIERSVRGPRPARFDCPRCLADLPKSTFAKLRKSLMHGFIHFLDSPSMGSHTTFLPRPPRIVLLQWIRFLSSLSVLPSNDHSIPWFSCSSIYIYIYI